MASDRKEDIEYFHVTIRDESTLVKKLKLAKVQLDCLTFEELIQRLWDIAKHQNNIIKIIDGGVK